MVEAQAEASHWPAFGGWNGPEEDWSVEDTRLSFPWAIFNPDSHVEKVLLGHSSKKSIGLGAKTKSYSSERLWEPQGDGLVQGSLSTCPLV